MHNFIKICKNISGDGFWRPILYLILLENASSTKSFGSILVEKIIKSIELKHHCEITVEELMLEFNISRKTMERQFKKMLGYTPKNFIYLLKFCKTFLKYVKEMKTLKEIDYFYTDNSYFNVVFKKITGYTPRKLYKATKNNEIRIYQIQRY